MWGMLGVRWLRLGLGPLTLVSKVCGQAQAQFRPMAACGCCLLWKEHIKGPPDCQAPSKTKTCAKSNANCVGAAADSIDCWGIQNQLQMPPSHRIDWCGHPIANPNEPCKCVAIKPHDQLAPRAFNCERWIAGLKLVEHRASNIAAHLQRGAIAKACGTLHPVMWR